MRKDRDNCINYFDFGTGLSDSGLQEIKFLHMYVKPSWDKRFLSE